MSNNILLEIIEEYNNSNCDMGLGIIYETKLGFPYTEENTITCNFFKFPAVVDTLHGNGMSYERYCVGKIISEDDCQRALSGRTTYEQLEDLKKSINNYHNGLYVAIKIGLTDEFVIASLYENTKVFDNIGEMLKGVEKRCQLFKKTCPDLSHTIIKKVQPFEKRIEDILINSKTDFDRHRNSL